MSTGLRKMVVHTITGTTYARWYTSAEVADIEEQMKDGVGGLVDTVADLLGRAADSSGDMKLNAAGIGWVALNPNHIVSVEFHGTEDVE